MQAGDLPSMVTYLLAISLATERLVVVVKTLLPGVFAEEKKTEAKEVDLIADRWRRIAVQFIAFLAAWCTASFFAISGAPDAELTASWNPFGQIVIGGLQVPVPLVALLCSGGSAFWAQVVGYASALKDIGVANKSTASLEFKARAASLGLVPADSGVVAGNVRLDKKQMELLTKIDKRKPTIRLATPSGG